MTNTPPPPSRAVLPLFGSAPHGSRSAMTCLYRCGNACSHPEPNPTLNETIHSIIERTIARRAVLKAGALTAGALVLGRATSTIPAVVAGTTARIQGSFTPVEPNVRDAVTVPDGYAHDVVIGWGDPVVKGAPPFDVHSQTPASAAQQFGYNCDYVGVLQTSPTTALLVVNHEYTDEALMFPTGRYSSRATKRIAMASHGMSVVEIRRSSTSTGAWSLVPVARTQVNRRITATTPFRLDGPAAGDRRLRTSGDTTGRRVLGTLNNCAGGTTPWGTVLSGEENFNQYFDKSGKIAPRYVRSYARYGLTGVDSRGWSGVDPRFDLTKEPHEPFRFGWIVEVDPVDPGSTPRKHTMLGRLQHEGANIALADDGRVAVYMGDDARGDYIYKFVSRDRMDRGDGREARRDAVHLEPHARLR